MRWRDWLETMEEYATPDLYERNAFRLLEMPVEATGRELTRRRDLVHRATSSNFAVPPGPARSASQACRPGRLRSAASGARHTGRSSAVWYMNSFGFGRSLPARLCPIRLSAGSLRAISEVRSGCGRS